MEKDCTGTGCTVCTTKSEKDDWGLLPPVMPPADKNYGKKMSKYFEKEEVIADAIRASMKSRSLKTRAIHATKNAAKRALVRKISRKLVKTAHSNLLKAMESIPALQMLTPYFNSKMGKAAISGMLAVSIEFIPLPESIRDNFAMVKDSVVEELATMAIDEGTAPLEQFAGLLLPGIAKSLAPLLTGAEIKKLVA